MTFEEFKVYMKIVGSAIEEGFNAFVTDKKDRQKPEWMEVLGNFIRNK